MFTSSILTQSNSFNINSINLEKQKKKLRVESIFVMCKTVQCKFLLANFFFRVSIGLFMCFAEQFYSIFFSPFFFSFEIKNDKKRTLLRVDGI